MTPNDFKKLKKEWYSKLESEGFNDIEKKERSEYTLKRPVNKALQHKNGVFRTGKWQIKQEYYNMASQFLQNFTFESEIYRIIWEYHAEGLKIVEIVSILKKLKLKQGRYRAASKTQVSDIIIKHRNIMKKMMWATEADEANEQ